MIGFSYFLAFAQVVFNSPSDALSPELLTSSWNASLGPSVTAVVPKRDGTVVVIAGWGVNSLSETLVQSFALRKSLNSGNNWEKILFLDTKHLPEVVAIDLTKHPLLCLNNNEQGLLLLTALTNFDTKVLLASTTEDNGTTWNSLNFVSSIVDDVGYFAARLNDEGFAITVFENFDGITRSIQESHATIGSGFSLPVDISDPFFSSFQPTVALNNSNEIIVAFQTITAPETSVIQETHWDTIGPWSGLRDLSVEKWAALPAIDMNEDRLARLAWVTTDEQKNGISSSISLNSGENWSAGHLLASYPLQIIISQIAVALNNNQREIVAWQTDISPQALEKIFQLIKRGMISEEEAQQRLIELQTLQASVAPLSVASFTRDQLEAVGPPFSALGESVFGFDLVLTDHDIAFLAYRGYDTRNGFNTPPYWLARKEFFGTLSLIVSDTAGQSWLLAPYDASIRQLGISQPKLAAVNSQAFVTWNHLMDEDDVLQRGLFLETIPQLKGTP